jgi:hypothetical protein
MTIRHVMSAGMLLVLAGLLMPASATETELSNYLPECTAKFGLCRYIHTNTRQELIPPRFENAMPFSEGLAGVRLNGRFGYIDRRGEFVIQPQFDRGGEFYQGRAEIVVDGNAGVIDRTGQVIVPPRFRRAIPLTKDVIVAVEGQWRPENLENLGSMPVPGAGLYHVSGRWIRRPGPDLIRISGFDAHGSGLVWATIRGDKSDLIGLMASDGSWVIEPQYSYAGQLLDDRAIVRKQIDGVSHSGAVDASGKLVVPLKPWLLFYWHSGQAIAQEKPGSGQKQALVDKNGDIIGGRWFDKVQRAETGDVATVWIGDRPVGLDRAGNIIDHPANGRVIGRCSNGIRAVEIDGRMQIIDAAGRPTTPHLFHLGPSMKFHCDRPTSVRLNGKWGFVGPDGRLLLDPPRFDTQYDFDFTSAVVQQDGKWGIIDRLGRFTVEPKFDAHVGRRDGLFHMKLGDRDVWIDANGQEKPEPTARDLPAARALDCGHGVRMFSRDGLWGIVDGDKEIIAPKYRAMICFRLGTASAPIDGKRQWCPLGPDGAERDRPACTATNYPDYLTHSAPEKFADDPFESSVLWTRAWLEFAEGRRDRRPRWVSGRMR